MTKLKVIWNDKNIAISSMIRLLRSLALSIFLYACETWTIAADIERKIHTPEMRCFRKLLGISYRDHITNEEMKARIGNAIGPYEDLLASGWCMLGVLLLPAFTCLGHDCQDFLSPLMECMCAQTTPRFILSSERAFREWSQNPCKVQGKNPLYRKKSPQMRIEPTTLYHGGQRAHHTTKEICRPPLDIQQYRALMEGYILQ